MNDGYLGIKNRRIFPIKCWWRHIHISKFGLLDNGQNILSNQKAFFFLNWIFNRLVTNINRNIYYAPCKAKNKNSYTIREERYIARITIYCRKWHGLVWRNLYLFYGWVNLFWNFISFCRWMIHVFRIPVTIMKYAWKQRVRDISVGQLVTIIIGCSKLKIWRFVLFYQYKLISNIFLSLLLF